LITLEKRVGAWGEVTSGKRRRRGPWGDLPGRKRSEKEVTWVLVGTKSDGGAGRVVTKGNGGIGGETLGGRGRSKGSRCGVNLFGRGGGELCEVRKVRPR